MEEIWKDIPGFPGYQASNCGRIRSHNKVTSSSRFPVRHWKDRILKQKVSKDRCSRVSLWKDGKEKTVLVHRLIASTFLENLFDTRMTVNHKDGNRQNNSIENLEWLTTGDNIRHGFRTGLYDRVQKPCVLAAPDGMKYEFPSLSEASRFLGRSEGYASLVTRSNRFTLKSSKGEMFEVVPF